MFKYLNVISSISAFNLRKFKCYEIMFIASKLLLKSIGGPIQLFVFIWNKNTFVIFLKAFFKSADGFIFLSSWFTYSTAFSNSKISVLELSIDSLILLCTIL